MALEIGFLVFPKLQQLDLTGPYEVFAALPGTRVHLIWKTLAPVIASSGLSVVPTVTMQDCPRLDVICVCGGAGIDPLLEDEETLAFLRAVSAGARYITSVCTGSLVLAAAGLLDNKHAATHWTVRDLLGQLGAKPQAARVVRDGRILTGGGVTAGIDFALTLVAELAGTTEAQAIQLALEYAPAPPFDAGRPEQCPLTVLALVKQRGAALRAEREVIVGRVALSHRTASNSPD
jgi:cyclohexyl-isocyanide hydratase